MGGCKLCCFFEKNVFLPFLGTKQEQTLFKDCGIDKISKIKKISKRKIMFKHYSKVYIIF